MTASKTSKAAANKFKYGDYARYEDQHVRITEINDDRVILAYVDDEGADKGLPNVSALISQLTHHSEFRPPFQQAAGDAPDSGGHIKPGSGFISGWRDSRDEPVSPPLAQIDPDEIARLEAMPSGEIDIPRLIDHMASKFKIPPLDQDPAETPTIAQREIDLAGLTAKPFAAGTSAFHLDEPVYVIDDQSIHHRDVFFLEDETRYIQVVEVEDLRPADEPVSLSEFAINLLDRLIDKDDQIKSHAHALRDAQAEWDTAAHLKREADERITELEQGIETKSRAMGLASALVTELQQKLSALEATNKNLEAVVTHKDTQMAEMGATIATLMKGSPSRKIETMTIYDFSDIGLADRLNHGWRVVFETYVMLPEPLTDELGDTRDARHFVRLEREVQDHISPPQDEAHAALSADTPADIDETPTITPPHEIVFSSTLKAVITADDIDLSKPLGENVARYGWRMVADAQNRQIAAGMKAVELHFSERFQTLATTLPRPVFAPQPR